MICFCLPTPYFTDTDRVPFFLSQPVHMYSLLSVKKTRLGAVSSPSGGGGSRSGWYALPCGSFLFWYREGSATWEAPLWPESSA